jgi:hypothetical protein
MLAEVVAERFRVDALERDPSSIVAIASDGEIGWANSGWFQFARANGGTNAAIYPGDNYFAAIAGEVRPRFEAAVSQCLVRGIAIEQDYECSSANVQRAFHLRMLPLGGQAVLLVHSLVAARACDRRSEPPDEGRYRDENGLIAQCSNCRRTRAPSDRSWHWVPAWVETVPARVSHVLCSLCRDFYWPRLVRDDAETTTA